VHLVWPVNRSGFIHIATISSYPLLLTFTFWPQSPGYPPDHARCPSEWRLRAGILRPFVASSVFRGRTSPVGKRNPD
jgi:hypothetical protein